MLNRGATPVNFLRACLIHVKETPYLNREGTKRGHFRSVFEKGRGLDLQDPPKLRS